MLLLLPFHLRRWEHVHTIILLITVGHPILRGHVYGIGDLLMRQLKIDVLSELVVTDKLEFGEP